MEALLGPKVLKGGQEVDTSSLSGAVVALYFSAHWCPPCKAFTPQFAKVYERCKQQGKSFDVVFISSDKEDVSFRQYFSTMPWHALPFANRVLKETLSTRFGVRGIPRVVLINRDGSLIDANANSKVMAPAFPSTLPRVVDAEVCAPLPEGPVMVELIHQQQKLEIEVEPDEGWELLRMQIFSVTDIPVEQQRLFGLGVPTGMLAENVPLPQALARGLSERKPPVIVVLGNFSKDDPFEVAGSAPPAGDAMLREQHLAFLQAKLSSAATRLQHQAHSLQHVFKYEDLAAQRHALDQIPVATMAQSIIDEAPAEGYDLAFMRKLLRWFKADFFSWTNTPKCEHCGSKDTKALGGTAPNQIEQSYGAGSVEVAQCNTCGQQTRFPRYNDPSKLLETRQGRCGEWANCFTLVCRALGFEARHVHDWTDHVWTEIYSDSLGRWVHADSCEAALDCPKMYETGWGKKLTYCIAFGRDNVCDVTRRYTMKYSEVLTRRNQFPEDQLKRTMSALDEFALDSSVSKLPEAAASQRRDVLAKRAEAEAKEFSISAASEIKEGEQVGRTSGDKEWREQRGELGANADAKARALACSDTGIKAANVPSVPGSWLQSAEHFSMKDGILTSDLKRRDGTWQRGVSIQVEDGASYSNDDGQFVPEREIVHDLIDIHSSTASDACQEHRSILVPNGFEQLVITCRWMDQGFGNQKGKIFLKLKRGQETICSHDCFGIAPHNWESKSKTISASDLSNPQFKDRICIEYVVGGGGGHQLHVEQLKLSVVRNLSSTAAPAPATAAGGSNGGYPSGTSESPVAPAKTSLKEEMQALVKKSFAELVASGIPPNEAAAKAIENAKKEQLQTLTKQNFAELVASGVPPNEAAVKAIENAKQQLS